MAFPPRVAFVLIFLACAALLADAVFYMQDHLGLDPCPMCVLQRYVFVALGIVALVAAIHGPRGRGVKVYGGLLVALALVGAGIAIRHSYIQHFPPPSMSCGTDLEFLLNAFPVTQALPKIFAGTGDCSAVKWKFLGLSIPEWALVWYVILGGLAAWAAFFRRPAARS